ncbi:MAG: copper chaperone PCu(A)C [Hyphomicrobium sp.]
MRHFVTSLTLLLLALVSPTAAHAADAAITVENLWARATPGGATVGAAYGVIRNAGADADRLMAIATPLAGRAEIHTHSELDGVMQMRRIEALDIAAGGSAVLAPGGHHLMLFDLKQPLKAGDRVPLTLIFEKAGVVTADAEIMAIGAAGPGTAGSH